MILIADSGSSKTDWMLINQHQATNCRTQGMNPLTTPPQQLANIALQAVNTLQINSLHIHSLHFYGAGCGNQQAQQTLQNTLQQTLPLAHHINIHTDLLGACRATLADNPGLVGILGTGSNACHYDGTTITHSTPSTGYILGDQGSGNHIGRLLLQDYFANRMPQHLSQQLPHDINIPHHRIIHDLYAAPQPNQFLAQIAHFAALHNNEPYIKQLINNSLTQYFQTQVLPLGHTNTQINFVGSVANQFADQLTTIATHFNLHVATILQHPINGLAAYHKKHILN